MLTCLPTVQTAITPQSLICGGLTCTSHGNTSLLRIEVGAVKLQPVQPTNTIKICQVRSVLCTKMLILAANAVAESRHVGEHRLHRLAPNSQLNSRAYISEVAPCIRQAPLQFVRAHAQSNQLHQTCKRHQRYCADWGDERPTFVSEIEFECRVS